MDNVTPFNQQTWCTYMEGSNSGYDPVLVSNSFISSQQHSNLSASQMTLQNNLAPLYTEYSSQSSASGKEKSSSEDDPATEFTSFLDEDEDRDLSGLNFLQDLDKRVTASCGTLNDGLKPTSTEQSQRAGFSWQLHNSYAASSEFVQAESGQMILPHTKGKSRFCPSIEVTVSGPPYHMNPKKAALCRIWMSCELRGFPNGRKIRALAELAEISFKTARKWLTEFIRLGLYPLSGQQVEQPVEQQVEQPVEQPLQATCVTRHGRPTSPFQPRNIERKYICIDCHHTFKRKDDWIKHTSLNYVQSYWQCLDCGYRCAAKRREKLKQHFEIKHSPQKLAVDAAIHYRQIDGPFEKQCGFCGHICKSFDDFTGHVSRHFEDSTADPPYDMRIWRDPWTTDETERPDHSEDDDDDPDDSNQEDGQDEGDGSRDFDAGYEQTDDNQDSRPSGGSGSDYFSNYPPADGFGDGCPSFDQWVNWQSLQEHKQHRHLTSEWAQHSRQNMDGKEQRHLLDSFLDISDAPEDDLMRVEARRMRGSCEWLTEKQTFKKWRDSKDAHMYWISAKPGTGKSVLSGYIVKHLKDSKRDCAFYFFDYSDKPKATISSFLRSMAWQMAVMHARVLRTVLDVSEKDDQLSKADYRSLWRKLFLDGILGVKLEQPQYWVVDALDECASNSELVPLLLKASEMCNVRIVVTSRNKYESHSLMSHSKTKVVSEEILEDNTKQDISLYLEANVDCLPSVDEEAQDMIAKILAKSAGCFLWVILVLQQLRQVHTSAETLQVLEDVPSDMDGLYSRILHSMSKAPDGKLLAKAIFTWIVCSARPLTTEELYCALQLDIKDNIDKIEKSIAACCGQLVYVNQQSRVHMIHQTARDFLLRPGTASEFTIDKETGHQRLATTCIEYLSGDEMKAPRHRKIGVSNVVKPRCAFANYACSSLYEHISHVSSADDDFLTTLVNFLSSSNVLSWIEFLVQHSDLRCIIQTGRSFRKYLQRRSRYMFPFGKSVAILDSWATGLVRLVAKFGGNLLNSPTLIFHLIPPFCPLGSAPRMQFAASTRGIAVAGLSATTWDDCLSTIAHPQEQLTALTCSDKHFAVGLSTGKIAVYHEMTCQEAQTLQHQEPVRILRFARTGKRIASGGMKIVRLWDVTSWQQLWKLDVTQECMSFQFTDEDRILLGALRSNYLMIWDLTTGTLGDSANWTQGFEGESAHAFRRPITAAICVESSLLAVAYRGQDILLWDIEENAVHKAYGKETGENPGTRQTKNMVTGGLVFCLDPSASLLATSYPDGDLVLFDTFQGIVKEKTLANAQTLASSPDRRTLASADSAGMIQLFDFETLKLHCRINLDEHGIKALVFGADSRRLLDIRGSECRAWDPAVLLRQDVDEETSDIVSISIAPQEVMLKSSEDVSAEEFVPYPVTSDGSTALESISWVERRSYRWGARPANQDELMLICDNVAHLYNWQMLRRLTRFAVIKRGLETSEKGPFEVGKRRHLQEQETEGQKNSR